MLNRGKIRSSKSLISFLLIRLRQIGWKAQYAPPRASKVAPPDRIAAAVPTETPRRPASNVANVTDVVVVQKNQEVPVTVQSVTKDKLATVPPLVRLIRPTVAASLPVSIVGSVNSTDTLEYVLGSL